MCFPLLLLNSECSPIQSPQSQADGHQDRSFSAMGCLLKSFPSVAPLLSSSPNSLRNERVRPNERQFVRHWDAFRWSPPRELGTALPCLIMQFSQPPSGMSCLHCPKCRGGRSYAENNNGSIIQFEICAFCEFQFVLNGNEQKLGSSELTEL